VLQGTSVKKPDALALLGSVRGDGSGAHGSLSLCFSVSVSLARSFPAQNRILGFHGHGREEKRVCCVLCFQDLHIFGHILRIRRHRYKSGFEWAFQNQKTQIQVWILMGISESEDKEDKDRSVDFDGHFQIKRQRHNKSGF
jgi:hypothetical protein